MTEVVKDLIKGLDNKAEKIIQKVQTEDRGRKRKETEDQPRKAQSVPEGKKKGQKQIKKKVMQENLPELTGIVSTLKKPASSAPQAFPPGYITTGKFHNTED